MNIKNIRNRILFDIIGSIIGAALIYISFIIALEINSPSHWDKMIAFVALTLASGFMIGFFAINKDGIFLASLLGIIMLGIFAIYGIQGKGLYEVIDNYVLALVIYIIVGVLVFILELLGSLLGRMLSPKIWKRVKGELKDQERGIEETASSIQEAKPTITTDQETQVRDRNFCTKCGAEIPFGVKNCLICLTPIETN